MQTTRRNIFKFLGGSALGAVLTPAPWRLITATALWSENWPGIPRPARGELKTKFTHCALCPAGCAVKARCINGQPISLAGVPAHPLSQGALCPFGIAGHHLPYQPGRLTQGPVQQAAAAVSAAINNRNTGERVAVLDLCPGRTASWTYRRAMAALTGGVYLTAAPPFGGAAADLSKVRTILSFGAPVLEGWGTPGNMAAKRSNFRLIHAEAVESNTAAMADTWLRIRPGSEEALALGIASALAARGPLPADVAAVVNGFTPAKAAAETGLTEEQIQAVAREVAANGPALAIGNDTPALAALNVLTGAFQHVLVARQEAPVPDEWKNAPSPVELNAAPGGSIRVLLIDESAGGDYIPWNAIQRKLARDAVVVAFAPSREGYGRHAQFTLPTAVYPEILDDVPPSIDSPVPAFRLAAPLVTAPAGMVSAPEFVAKAAGLDAANALRERADAIQKAGQGTLYAYADSKSTPVKDVAPDDFWKALNEGGCWMGDAASTPASPQFRSAQRSSGGGAELPLAIALVEPHAAAAQSSPLLSKLYQESNLRLGPGRIAVHPRTAASCGLAAGAQANFETSLGKLPAGVLIDSSVPEGVVAIAATASVLDLCGASERARVVRA